MKHQTHDWTYGSIWARVCALHDTYAQMPSPHAPEPGSEAELIGALRRFRDAVQREPCRELVRYLHS